MKELRFTTDYVNAARSSDAEKHTTNQTVTKGNLSGK